jgi:hypothetical protein
MILDIHNISKLMNSEYHNGRFVCTNTIDTSTNYRFQFRDNNGLQLRYIWVEISRIGEYDIDTAKWGYRLNYPNSPTHIVTAQWLGFPPNAVKLMEDCLKYSL